MHESTLCCSPTDAIRGGRHSGALPAIRELPIRRQARFVGSFGAPERFPLRHLWVSSYSKPALKPSCQSSVGEQHPSPDKQPQESHPRQTEIPALTEQLNEVADPRCAVIGVSKRIRSPLHLEEPCPS